MDDDFSTPAAVGAIFDAVADANRAHDAGEHERAASLAATVSDLLGVLGLKIGTERAADDEIDALVARRDEARRTRDFAEADRIRDELAARGITLEDSAGTTTWHRT
jgi:cysteinyl-tRNA synthetase